jgi:sarcosine oxidase
VVRHHRRVTAVEPDGDGVLVRSAAGAVVHARLAIIAAGAWTAEVRYGIHAHPLPGTRTPTGAFVLDRIGPVVVAPGFSGHGSTSAPAVGRLLADLAVGAPSEAPAFTVPADAAMD